MNNPQTLLWTFLLDLLSHNSLKHALWIIRSHEDILWKNKQTHTLYFSFSALNVTIKFRFISILLKQISQNLVWDTQQTLYTKSFLKIWVNLAFINLISLTLRSIIGVFFTETQQTWKKEIHRGCLNHYVQRFYLWFPQNIISILFNYIQCI